MENNPNASQLSRARARFVSEWGALGSAWGINRSMASLHARLLVAAKPMSQDDLMDELELSRGNTSSNLRELVGWGLVRQVAVRGERRQYFVAEKEPWRIFVTITRERLRREIDPALMTLEEVAEMAEDLDGDEAEEFRRVVGGLAGFLRKARRVARSLIRSEEGVLAVVAGVLS